MLENLGRAEEAEEAVVRELVESSLARVQAQRRSGRIGRRFEALRVLEEAVRRDRDGERLADCRKEAIACLALADLDPIPIAMGGIAAMPVGVDIDPDHDRVALALPDGTIVVRSLPGDREFARLDGGGMPSARIRFGPGGRHVAAKAERDGRSAFRVYDLETGRRILDVPAGAFQAAFDFHPTLPIVAAGRRDGSILLYDLGTGEVRSRMEPGAVPWAIRFDASGRRLAVVSPRSDEALQIRDTDDGRLLASHIEPERARVVDWHPDGRWLAAAGEDGRIHLMDAEDPAGPRRILEGHGGPVVELAHHPGGNLLASTGEDGTLRLWDITTGRELVRGPAHLRHRLRFSRNGSILGPGDDGSSPCLWKLEAGQEFTSLMASGGPGRPIRSVEPWAIRRSWPRLPTTASASRGGHPGQARPWARMPGTLAAISTPGGRSVVSAGPGGLLLWPVSGVPDGPCRVGPPESIGPGPGQPATRLALSRDGATLAASLDDERGRVIVLDMQGNRPPIELNGHPRADYIAVSPDGLTVATGTREGDGVKLWDARTGEVLAELPVQGAADVAFSPDGRRLLTCEGPHYRLWDLATRAEAWRHPRDQSGDQPGKAAFRADGRMLAVAGTRNIVRLLCPAEGEVIASLEPPDPQEITGLAFEPDGNLLVLAPGVDAVRRWDLDALRLGLDGLGLGGTDLATGPRSVRPHRPAPEVVVEPAPWLGPIERGDRAIQAGRWAEATAAYCEAIDAGAPNVDPWTRLALIAAASGDGPAYREACSRLLARFRGASPVPKVANNVAWTCALAPSALDEYGDAHHLAFGAASGDREPSRWNTVGAVLYRAGRLDEAIQQLGHSVESHGAGGTPYDALFLSMAYRRRGDDEEAARWFRRALRPGPAAMRKPDVSGPSSWIPAIELDLLRREAIALFDMPAP
ncbi:MAG: hypothetical protein U0800_01345 [Isosphaeraceae bacterium]